MSYPDEPIRQKSPKSSDLPSSDPAKLSSAEGVKKGMGTIALKPQVYPGLADERGSKNGTPVIAGAAASKPLHELSDAEVMLLAGTGDDSAFEYLVEKFRR